MKLACVCSYRFVMIVYGLLSYTTVPPGPHTHSTIDNSNCIVYDSTKKLLDIIIATMNLY